MARTLKSGHARRRSDSADAAAYFSRWFGLTVQALNTTERRGWSSSLAIAMEEELGEPTDDAYLRRVAKGERLPQLEKTHSLGEGLRAAGLMWCSGTLALLRHPYHQADAYGILDLVSREPGTAARITLEWFKMARWLEFRESHVGLGGSPETLRTIVSAVEWARERLASLTSRLHVQLRQAWETYQAGGVGRIYGLFGGLHLISTDARFAPVAAEFCATLEKPLFDLDPTLIKGRP